MKEANEEVSKNKYIQNLYLYIMTIYLKDRCFPKGSNLISMHERDYACGDCNYA